MFVSRCNDFVFVIQNFFNSYKCINKTVVRVSIDLYITITGSEKFRWVALA